MISKYAKFIEIKTGVWAAFNTLLMQVLLLSTDEYKDAIQETSDDLEFNNALYEAGIYIENAINDEVAINALRNVYFQNAGIGLCLDDFGSGYSSLNMLKDTPFDVIKIDRGFLQDFMGSGRGQEIVRYTIQMTQAIGLDLVAEGVETKDQAEFLSDCGCDIAQGFYYAKPMPLEDFNKKMEMA